MLESTIWQTFGPEELDRTVRLMIRLRLIRRRRIWVLVQGRQLLKVRGSVEPAWEHQVTRPGALVLDFLEWLTRLKVLKP